MTERYAHLAPSQTPSCMLLLSAAAPSTPATRLIDEPLYENS